DPPAGIGREQPRAASDEANPNDLPRPLTPADCGAGAGVPYESGPVAGARGEVLARWSEGQRVDYRLRPGQALLYRTSFSIPQFDREVGAGLIVKLAEPDREPVAARCKRHSLWGLVPTSGQGWPHGPALLRLAGLDIPEHDGHVAGRRRQNGF